MRWPRGLRAAILGTVAAPEQTDEELAAGAVNGELVAVISFAVWSRIRHAGLEFAVPVFAEHGGLGAVWALTRRIALYNNRADRP